MHIHIIAHAHITHIYGEKEHVEGRKGEKDRNRATREVASGKWGKDIMKCTFSIQVPIESSYYGKGI